MNIDTLVRRKTKPLTEAMTRQFRASGFIPPGLHMRRMTAAITGVGIALSDASFVTRSWLARSKLSQVLGEPDTELASLFETIEKNALYIAGMNLKLKANIAAFHASEETFRESESAFIKVSFDGMKESLRNLNQVGTKAGDPTLAALIRSLISTGVETLEVMEACVVESTGKKLHEER